MITMATKKVSKTHYITIFIGKLMYIHLIVILDKRTIRKDSNIFYLYQ